MTTYHSPSTSREASGREREPLPRSLPAGANANAFAVRSSPGGDSIGEVKMRPAGRRPPINDVQCSVIAGSPPLACPRLMGEFEELGIMGSGPQTKASRDGEGSCPGRG